MPKVVDHDSRREHIIDATWRLLQREGFEGLTMRQIAAEAGYAHGAMKAYFPDKQSILVAAFERARARTDARAAVSLGRGLTGLAAIRALCLEIMPTTEEARAESRVVVAFWDRAVTDRDLWDSHFETNIMWRRQLSEFLAEAREAGEISTRMADVDIVSVIASSNAGLQVLSLLLPNETTGAAQIEMLEAFLDSIASPLGRERLAAAGAGRGSASGERDEVGSAAGGANAGDGVRASAD
ncbi:MAG: TetR/AcrR family transcriptional regulator [Pseudoclavibacter sp.]